MRFLSVGDFSPPPDALMVRQSMRSSIMGFVVFGGLTVGLAMGIITKGWPWPVWFGVALFGLCTMLGYSMLRACLKKSNWTMCVAGDGLFIKFRSYLNHHFPPEDPVIVRLDGPDLLAARRHDRKMTREMGDGTVTWKQIKLELTLAPGLTDLLADAIAAERRRRAPHRGFVSTTSRHCPVGVALPDTLQVTFRCTADRLTPTIDPVLQRIASLVRIESHESSVSDIDAMTPAQLDDYVLELCETGKPIAAVSILSRRYGYTTTEAKNFIDDLTGKAA